MPFAKHSANGRDFAGDPGKIAAFRADFRGHEMSAQINKPDHGR